MGTANFLTLILTLVIVQSCNNSRGKGVTEEIFWVHGIKTECDAGAGQADCLVIYRNDFPTDMDREYFYGPIEGFSFEEGVMQKIKVRIEKLDSNDLPADASNLKHILVEVVKKQPDAMVHLQGFWVLNQLNEQAIDDQINEPTLYVDLQKKRISGNTGCNDYRADIAKLSIQKLAFGNISSTRKACPDMNLEAEYGLVLKNAITYQVNSENLAFYDAKGKPLATFKKKEQRVDARINDIWVATRIAGNPIKRMVKAPRLEVNLDKMMLMGNDGCNNYSAPLEKISENTIEIGNMVSTQKACKNMEAAERYSKALNNSATYEIGQGTLTFHDKQGEEALFFLKID